MGSFSQNHRPAPPGRLHLSLTRAHRRTPPHSAKAATPAPVCRASIHGFATVRFTECSARSTWRPKLTRSRMSTAF